MRLLPPMFPTRPDERIIDPRSRKFYNLCFILKHPAEYHLCLVSVLSYSTRRGCSYRQKVARAAFWRFWFFEGGSLLSW